MRRESRGRAPSFSDPPRSRLPARLPTPQDGLLSLFKEQQEFMTFFFENLDYEPIEKFCNACLTTKGVIFFSGVGKSGFIAQKISMTLVSTGTKAVFLNPTDALHGNIGILSEDDLLVMFSKSGSTEELLRLVPYARAKGAKLVSVTSIKGCKLVSPTAPRPLLRTFG